MIKTLMIDISEFVTRSVTAACYPFTLGLER
jgi:hypothetical protein